MLLARIVVGVLVLGMLSIALPTNGVLHDLCLNPATDAGKDWIRARAIASDDCVGEMLLGVDDADWYFRSVPPTTAASTAHVQLCPLAIKHDPWNPDLEVYFLPGGAAQPLNSALFSSGLVHDLVLAILATPGPSVGSSSNLAGCDSVEVAAPVPSNEGRWFVFVKGTTGDGFYHLQFSIS